MKCLGNRGATLIEYALVVSLIVITAVAGMKGVSNSIAGQSNSVSSKITNAFNQKTTDEKLP